MYGKLVDGLFVGAPKKLVIDGNQIWNAPSDVYIAQGWFPVIFTEPPEAPTGYYYESGWTEEDDEIVQTWTLVELPDEVSDSEALAAILEALG